MIVTPHFVFLHLHKSGGSFVNDCLLRFLPDAQQIGYHLPRKLVPAIYSALPALGLVRNPWSYYVSWYTFQARRRQPNALFSITSHDGALGFAGTLRNLVSLGSESELLDPLLARLPATYVNRGLNLPAFALEPIRGSGLGFYSFLYRYMFDAPGLMHIGRMERMRTDLPPMFASVGQTAGPAMRRYIEQEPARNTSEHSSYTDYYDQASRELVARLDAPVIERHGYRFGD